MKKLNSVNRNHTEKISLKKEKKKIKKIKRRDLPVLYATRAEAVALLYLQVAGRVLRDL